MIKEDLLKSMLEKIDYKEIGLKVGLEIHRQLNTKHKLFCKCPTIEIEGKETIFIRKLRPTISELGEVDQAALFEAERHRTIVYHAKEGNTCLVEMDEEPPHPINQEAVEIGLTIALMLGMKIVDEIHVMRKIVIDGSNTCGFQRTCILATGGKIIIEGKEIPINTLCLEEDAATLIGREDDIVHYDLSRLGIPLVEISTAPSINSPEEARKVALAIGNILRSTSKVKRGIGSIRQDINISIKNGALVEIKGVQELDLIPKVIENEVKRQILLLYIKEELNKRNIKKSDLKFEIFDITKIFENTKCKLIKDSIGKGNKVYALKLNGFGGLLNIEAGPNIRFGAELNNIAKAWTGIRGIFHTDEMPAYGISENEINSLKEMLNASNNDAIVFIVEKEDKAEKALEKIYQRALEAIEKIPEETRAAQSDGTTIYSRPRPGSARMYPETDIPPLKINEELLEKIKSNLPEPIEIKIKRIIEKYKLSKQLANSLIDMDKIEIFEELTQYSNVAPSFIASILTEAIINLRREGYDISNIKDEHFKEIIKMINEKKIAKESSIEILKYICKNPKSKIEEAIKELSLEYLSIDEVKSIVEKIVKDNLLEIKNDPLKAEKKLMGILMKSLRGKIDGKILNEILKEKINEIIKKDN
ncbi:MAG: Glu-tRNA(Gln) amidotransferase subunit GatE [Nitrososphaerota archaeon]